MKYTLADPCHTLLKHFTADFHINTNTKHDGVLCVYPMCNYIIVYNELCTAAPYIGKQ